MFEVSLGFKIPEMNNGISPGKATAVLILAAGKSERMGRPKAFLPWDENTTFIEKIASTFYRAGFSKMIITVNASDHERMKGTFSKSDIMPVVVLNPHPELGRFYSVQAGLRNCPGYEFYFIQNVDNPFITPDILKIIHQQRNSSGYTVPVFRNRRGHPVLISKIIMKYILEQPGDQNLKELLKLFLGNEVETGSDKILVNINDEKDWHNNSKFAKI